MSKKLSFRLFVILLWTILVSYMISLSEITLPVQHIIGAMLNPYLGCVAVASCLIIGKKRYHRSFFLVIAILTAIILQFLSDGSNLLTWELLYKFIAFYIYIYLVSLSRYMI